MNQHCKYARGGLSSTYLQCDLQRPCVSWDGGSICGIVARVSRRAHWNNGPN
ncbi:hypothetical protein N9P82_00045 [bacterium]|nr:hypothetical protein [bacterium]